MASDLSSNPTFRAKAEAFLSLAAEAVMDDDQINQAVKRGSGYQFTMGVFFEPRETVVEAQYALIKPVLRKLGALRGSEAELRSLTWLHASAWVSADTPEPISTAAASLLDAMAQCGREPLDLYLPNYTFRLATGVEGVNLGRVAILPSALAAEAAAPFSKTFRVDIDEGCGQSFDEVLITHFVKVCWRVQLHASPQNAREEAAWLVDVAISLIRKLHRPWRGLAPDLKDREPNAFEPTLEDDPSFYIQGDSYGAGPMSKARYYLIDEKAATALTSARSLALAALIFDPPPHSVAERVAQGLGWMTRARRAKDKSEAFLYFFTAFEALLSGEKGQPVTATIARHFAVLWHDEPEARRVAAKWLQDLYVVRSRLVHMGHREALAPDVRNLHNAADRIFRDLMLSLDLTMAANDFYAKLRDASFGAPWPHRRKRPQVAREG